jgi:hypothetical protein
MSQLPQFVGGFGSFWVFPSVLILLFQSPTTEIAFQPFPACKKRVSNAFELKFMEINDAIRN